MNQDTMDAIVLKCLQSSTKPLGLSEILAWFDKSISHGAIGVLELSESLDRIQAPKDKYGWYSWPKSESVVAIPDTLRPVGIRNMYVREGQEMTIETDNTGPYLVLTASRWALDARGIERLAETLRAILRTVRP